MYNYIGLRWFGCVRVACGMHRHWEVMGGHGMSGTCQWEKYVRGVMVCERARAYIEPAEAAACEESSAVA